MCSDLRDPGDWTLQRSSSPLPPNCRHPRKPSVGIKNHGRRTSLHRLQFNGYQRRPSDPSHHNCHLESSLVFCPPRRVQNNSNGFCDAFLKLYSLVPLTVYIIINSVITCFLHSKHGDDNVAATFVSFALSLFTPSTYAPETKFGRSQLKWTMLSSTLTLLPCLIFIRLLPLLSPETTSCTLALSHLNHSSPIPDCSPCFNLTATNSTFTGDNTPLQTNPGTPCVMMTTLDDFSTYFFLPLLLLGVWCLFEGGIDLILKLTFLLPQRLQLSARRRTGLFPIGGRRCHGSWR